MTKEQDLKDGIAQAFEKAPIKKRSGVDVYTGFQNSKQSFHGIGCLQALEGLVVLRGRNGQRDVLFTLPRAIDRYDATGRHVKKMAMIGARGWEELMEIQMGLKRCILEAISQCRAKNMDIEQVALDFEAFCLNKSSGDTRNFKDANREANNK